uniref:Uncharacterized protein n=1 Tax=Rhizophora mucronata TaxID=61149 RepID=A0A2P2PWX0_RHIMU
MNFSVCLVSLYLEFFFNLLELQFKNLLVFK